MYLHSVTNFSTEPRLASVLFLYDNKFLQVLSAEPAAATKRHTVACGRESAAAGNAQLGLVLLLGTTPAFIGQDRKLFLNARPVTDWAELKNFARAGLAGDGPVLTDRNPAQGG